MWTGRCSGGFAGSVTFRPSVSNWWLMVQARAAWTAPSRHNSMQLLMRQQNLLQPLQCRPSWRNGPQTPAAALSITSLPHGARSWLHRWKAHATLFLCIGARQTCAPLKGSSRASPCGTALLPSTNVCLAGSAADVQSWLTPDSALRLWQELAACWCSG